MEPVHGSVTKVPPDSAAGLDDPRVVRAVQEYLAAMEGGRKPDRAAFVERYPEIAGPLAECLAGLDFVQAAVPHLSQPLDGAPSSIGAEAITGTLGDFRLIREVGRGGMGVVYEAEQVSLGRRVALKVLPFRGPMDPGQLKRFHNEARAAASLHHTNIVPVYAVGCEHSVHFYAMQFIEGRSLADVIADLRREREGQPAKPQLAPTSLSAARVDAATGQTIEPPQQTAGASVTRPIAGLFTLHSIKDAAFFLTVAQLGIQAAEALDHAHEQGIVHRDVKPANLLVDAAGRLWVTDFGLAQVMSDTRMTMTGDLVGTLRYMSPEQALAKRALIDHRSDVYSLGATLYELLTLRPVFDGQDREELLRQIVFAELAAPRRLNRGVPEEPETIVLKATEKGLADRYTSAMEVADDLRRFLDNRPIHARRPSLIQRVLKWARRHHTAVLSAAVVLMVALLALAAETWLLWREKEATKAALERADAKTRWARRAVDDMYSEVAEKWLADRPHMTEVQRQFLRKALDFYEELTREQSADPEVRLQTVIAYHRMGMLSKQFEGLAKAEEYFRRAEKMAKDLADEFPDRATYRQEQFRATYQVGQFLWSHMRFDEAEGPLRRASSIATRLADDFPDVAAYQHDLAECLHTVAELVYRAHPDEAELTYREVARIQQGLVDKYPDVPGYRYDLAATQLSRVGFLAASGRLETTTTCLQALAELEDVLGRCLRTEGDRTRLDGLYTCLACLRMDLGRLEDAAANLDRPLKTRQKQCADYPAFPGNWNSVAFTLWKRGRLLTLTGLPREAEEAYVEAAAWQKKAVLAMPDNVFRRYELALMLGELGGHYLLGPARQEDARKALLIVQEALDLAPDGGEYLQTLLGFAYFRLGKSDQAIRMLEKARVSLEDPTRSQGWKKADDTFLVQAAGRNERATPGLILWLLAMSHHRQGDTTKAINYYQQAQHWQAQHGVPPHKAKALKSIAAEAAVVLGLPQSSPASTEASTGKE